MKDSIIAIAVCLVLLGIFTNAFEVAAAVLIAWAEAFKERRK